jgi:hypothetical protein
MKFTNSLLLLVCAFQATSAFAASPPGFVESTISLGGPLAGLAFDAGGTMYALEGGGFNQPAATLRIVLPDGTFGSSFPVTASGTSFFVGSMTFDPIGNRVLITDNAFISPEDPGRMYAVSTTGSQQTIASGIANIAGVAVRGTGEIFVSTANGSGNGAVLQVDRSTGATTPVLNGLDFGAGLDFDAVGNLIVQNASDSFVGSLQRLPMTHMEGGLIIGSPEPLAGGMVSSAGVVAVGNDFYATGVGGLYHVAGEPLAETLFDSNNGDFATALAFHPGSQPFERFTGPGGGKLVYSAHFNDAFITMLSPAQPGDYNGDGSVTTTDYDVWRDAFGTTDPAADGNRDSVVDAADYVLWRKNLPGAPAASAMNNATVPETMSAALLIEVITVAALRRRRRRPSAVNIAFAPTTPKV